MTEEKLLKEYLTLAPHLKKLYVVPLLNPGNKNTDYLYQLYENIINGNTGNIKIEFISVFAHCKIFVKRLYGENNLLHYHWFEASDLKSFAGIFWKIIWISLYKLIGGKIVWTIHNKYPHANKYVILNRALRKYLAKISNKLHVHCKSAIKIMSPILNVTEEKFFIIEHPNFKVTIVNKKNAVELLQDKYPEINLAADKKIFLSFGVIAEYKGLIEIIDNFCDIENAVLIITGLVKKVNVNYYNRLVTAAEGRENIYIISKFIDEDELNLFFGISDYVIFNFDDILTSGSVNLALNYNKKVIAPAMGCLNDIRDDNLIFFEKGSADSNLKNVLKSLVK